MKRILILLFILMSTYINAQVIGADVVNFTAKTEIQMNAITVAQGLQKGSVCYRSDTDSLWRYNGTTWNEISGSGIANVVEDTTPQLGGNLDVNGFAVNYSQDGSGVARWNWSNTVNSNTLNAGFESGGANAWGMVPSGTAGGLRVDYTDNTWKISTSPIVTQANAASLGVGGISNLVEDTTPELGGTLDGGGFAISNITALTTTSRVNTEELRFNPDNTIGSTTDFNTFGFKTGNVLYGQKVNSTIELGLDFNALTADKNLVFTDSDITWGGTSLLSGGGGSSPPFDDTTSLVQDPVDGTKEMRIDVGAVSTATTRTLTMPDADVDLGNLGASNLDLTDNYTWTGTHNFPNITEFNSTLKIIGNITTKFGGLVLYENDGTTQTGFLGYSTNSVRMSNVTSAQVLQLLDAGGADFNGNFTSDAFIKDGATSDDILLGDGTTTSLAGLGVGDPDQTLSLGGTGNKDLTISGTGGNTIDLTGVDGVDADNIVSKGTARTSPVQYTDIYGQTLANYNTDGAPGAGELVIITDASPAEVVATATIAMDGWKMYDDQTADAATITLSDCDPGETLTVYINRASAPTLAGTGLTFNQLPNTTAFASATQMMIIFEVAYDGTTIDYYYVER